MGALTLKPFSNESREWELFEHESLDVTDAFGVSLRVSVRENRVFCVEPLKTSAPWISDRSRMFFEGALYPSLTAQSSLWYDAFKNLISTKFYCDHIKLKSAKSSFNSVTFVFKRLSVEVLELLQHIESKFSSVRVRSNRKSCLETDLESQYLMSPDLVSGKLKYSSLAVLVGTNTRLESYVFNNLLRQRFLKGNFKTMLLGPKADLTVPSRIEGASLSSLTSLLEGTHIFCQQAANSSYPLFLASSRFFLRPGYKQLASSLRNVNFKSKCLVSVLPDSIEASGINFSKRCLPFSTLDYDETSSVYYINADLSNSSELNSVVKTKLLNLNRPRHAGKQLVIGISDSPVSDRQYLTVAAKMGTFFELPTKNIFEEPVASYINAAGTTLRTVKVLNSRPGSKSSWQALRALYMLTSKLSVVSNKKDNFLLANVMSNITAQKNFSSFNHRPTKTLTSLSSFLDFSTTSASFVNSGKIMYRFRFFRDCNRSSKIYYWLDDFFVGGEKDPFSASSRTLSKCSQVARVSSTTFF